MSDLTPTPFTREERETLIWCIQAIGHVDPDHDQDEYPDRQRNESLQVALELGKAAGYTPEEYRVLADIADEARRTLDSWLDGEYPADLFERKRTRPETIDYARIEAVEERCLEYAAPPPPAETGTGD